MRISAGIGAARSPAGTGGNEFCVRWSLIRNYHAVSEKGNRFGEEIH